MKALFKLIVIIGAITLSASQSYAEDQYRKLPSGKSEQEILLAQLAVGNIYVVLKKFGQIYRNYQ